ncbi:hypothetical protein IFR05_009940 [Cadophora sp. M221]|nr:hypothetical protein IFR05_009940 [Cadophora sp. M221]
MLKSPELILTLSLCIIASIAIYLHQLPGIPERPPRPSRFVVPRPPTPPIDTSSTPYNEDLIVSLLTKLYNLLIEIGYLPSETVVFPPPTGHDINVALCEALNIDPAVISLMKRIPYTNHRVNDSEQLEYPIFQGAWMYNFLQDDDTEQSRDPEWGPWSDDARREYILPHDLALTGAEDPDMEWLVLDTKENTIRRVGHIAHDDGAVLERPEDPNHYRNTSTENAASFLITYIERIESLGLLPFAHDYWQGVLDCNDSLHYPLKKILIEDYGWPGHFRREDWLQDKTSIWERVQSEHEEWKNRADDEVRNTTK